MKQAGGVRRYTASPRATGFDDAGPAVCVPFPCGAAALTTALADADPRVQGRAAEALGLIGHKAATTPIVQVVLAHVRATGRGLREEEGTRGRD